MSEKVAGTVLGREVKRALSAARLSAPAAASMLGWDRKRLYRWIDGSVSPRLEDVEAFARAIKQPVTLQLNGPENEEAAPLWAERLAARVRGDLTGEITKTRDVVVAAVAGQVGQQVGATLSKFQQQLLDALAQADGRPEE